MRSDTPYYFIGIGGSGMLPLALILSGQGARISGSDRSLDQGRTPDKFAWLRGLGFELYPQDGSGVTDPGTAVVASAAVEDTVPDMAAARKIGATVLSRAELLSQLFNDAETSIGVAGTSGKSTTTGMIGWLLTAVGRDPTVMNGAVMNNFTGDDQPFASARVGESGIFVSEVDESDGSIARYNPKIAVVNNISLDHKSMEELRALFSGFISRAETAVLNLDNAETRRLIESHPPLEGGGGGSVPTSEFAKQREANSGEGSAAEDPSPKNPSPSARIFRPSLKGRVGVVTYSLSDSSADLLASNIAPAPDGIAFDLIANDSPPLRVHLKVPGRHNVSNALAALATARALGVPLKEAADALSRFTGIRRRLEVVGTANGVTVIDDFAHNPDKIAATLATLHDFPGRLLLMFQPHGYSPLAKMKHEFVETFVTHLHEGDVLIMPEPVYYGGTTDKSVSSEDIADAITARGRKALAFLDRDTCGEELLRTAKPGDRIVIMGARDDTLTSFARDLLHQLEKRKT